jgi:Cu/Ag efflux protein CusF
MQPTLAVVLALALAAPAAAQPTDDMKATPGMSGPPGADQVSTIMAGGSGVVTAVDARAGSVTIHHGPIAKLSWPAMTMAFKASPAVLQGIKPGQSVTFTLMRTGGSTTLTAIRPK